MALSKRHLVLAATATTLGLGSALLPGASAMAATPEASTTVAAPASQSTTTATEASATRTDGYYCEWVYVWDDWGNWVYVEECYY